MILDLHVVNALTSGFAYYRTRESAFKGLFVGVGDATLSAWFADFSGAHFPSIRSRNAQGSVHAPLITVVPQAETVTQELLSDFGGRSASGEALDTYMISESLELAVFAKTPDMARVYHVVARASIALARRAMHRAGYHVFRYDGSEALAPEEELAAEELGISAKRLRVRGEYQVQIAIPSEAEYNGVSTFDSIIVQSDTLTTDEGVQGAVKAP